MALFQVIKKIFALFKVKKLYEFVFMKLSSEALALHSTSCAVQVSQTCSVEIAVLFVFAESKGSAAADFSKMSRVALLLQLY